MKRLAVAESDDKDGARAQMRNCVRRTTWLNTVLMALAVLLIALTATACPPATPVRQIRTVTGDAPPVEFAEHTPLGLIVVRTALFLVHVG